MKRELIKKISANKYVWFYETDGNVHYGYAETEEQARLDLEQKKAQCRLLMNDWFPVFLASEELKKSFKEITSVKYEQLYKSFIRPYIGNQSLMTITPENLEELMNQMAEHGNSPISISGVQLLLNRIFEGAIDGGLITSNPMKLVYPPKNKNKTKERQPFTEEELDELFHRLEEESKWSKGSTLLIVKIASWTGMRIAEILGLQWCDIDWDKGVIHVRHNLTYCRKQYQLTTLKTEKSRRHIPLSNKNLVEILAWRDNEKRLGFVEKADPAFKDLIFLSRTGNPVNSSSVSRAVHKAVVEMKNDGILDPDKEYTLHSTRHTFATQGVLKDMQPKVLSTLMGHSSIRVTMDIYAHVGEEMMRNEMKRCGMI